jgi:peptidoglycan-N-acetylglucosamine deacetylase
MRTKPIASISLDLDDQWSYMKTHGDKEWQNYPSYYSIFVPHVLEVLRELEITITFFIVGRDALDNNNKEYLRLISAEGHDIGNHSFNHEVWIDGYDRDQFVEELEKAEQAIFEATGKRTNGFRAPGFSWSETILEVLYDRHYLYDASTLPTFIGPFARLYYFWRSDFTRAEKSKRKNLFGPFSEGFRRVKPYIFGLNSGKEILEIPVTTIPVIRTPFHMSYLLYLSQISPVLMRGYLYFAIFMCKMFRTHISFLLHPLDIIGGDKIKELVFFPGMSLNTKHKILIFKDVMRILKKNFILIDMNSHALSILNSQHK